MRNGGDRPSRGEKLETLAGSWERALTTYILTGSGAPEEAGAVRIPAGLAEAAELLDLSYAKTRRLLAGKKSLVAERRGEDEGEWTAQDWIDFSGSAFKVHYEATLLLTY